MIFCRDFDESLKLHLADTHIIVYIDESFCHVNHRSSQSWWTEDKKSVSGRDKGVMMILIHVMTKYGFLYGSDNDMTRYPVGEWDTQLPKWFSMPNMW